MGQKSSLYTFVNTNLLHILQIIIFIFPTMSFVLTIFLFTPYNVDSTCISMSSPNKEVVIVTQLDCASKL